MNAITDEPFSVPPDVAKRAKQIKLILMDVDGVLTEGRVFYVTDAQGQLMESKAFNTQDGLGLYFCNELGIKTGVISGRDSPATVARAATLKMTYVFQGHLEKESIWDQILADAKLADEQVAFIGDDFTDVPLMRRAGLACAVANARPEVCLIAHYVTSAKGGEGAVREVIEIILRAQNLWQGILTKYKLLTAALPNKQS